MRAAGLSPNCWKMWAESSAVDITNIAKAIHISP